MPRASSGPGVAEPRARFAFEVAAQVQAACKDGVWFVELAPLADPALVPRVVAGALGVYEEPGRTLLIAYAACEQWPVAARLAGVLGSSDGAHPAAPPELSGRVARAYEDAALRTRAALGKPAFEDEAGAGGRMTREQAIVLALAE